MLLLKIAMSRWRQQFICGRGPCTLNFLEICARDGDRRRNSRMSDENDRDWGPDLQAIERRLKTSESPTTIARDVRALMDKVPEDSSHRAHVLRLRGIACNRCREPDQALAYLHQARLKAIEQQNLAEIVAAGREIAVVHSWRGEDRHAALALLRAVAAAYLHNDAAAAALALGEAGRIELEARRFDEAERTFRLMADRHPQPLDPYQFFRIQINLCQALNRLSKHDEALALSEALAANPPDSNNRLIFLTLLESAKAHAGLGNSTAAAASLDRARELLPADPNEFEHSEMREAEAELKLAQKDWTAIEDLKTLAKKYTAPGLTVRAANLRMLAANVLFETQQPAEARRLLAEALAAAFKAGLPDLAQRIRSEMLEGEHAQSLDAVLKDTRAVEAIGGEWSSGRQLIRVESLGEGGGGKVYRAIDLRDGKEVAVKEISLAAHSKERRAQILATVRNEYAVAVTLPDNVGIANVRGLLCDTDGTLLIVQDLIKGTSLSKLYTPEPALARLLPLLIDVADVLATLHSNRIVHRDLKPDNVMVRRGRQREEAVLIDFGIALLDEQSDTLKYFGTAGYMAPEQARAEKVDGRADIYSLGKMIAEMWVGDGRDSPIPKPLAGVVDQMLKEKPDDRPALDVVKAGLQEFWKTLKV
jgi:serine/threonine-protein kinase